MTRTRYNQASQTNHVVPGGRDTKTLTKPLTMTRTYDNQVSHSKTMVSEVRDTTSMTKQLTMTRTCDNQALTDHSAAGKDRNYITDKTIHYDKD